MPYVYPPAAPTVDSQGIETISRFLNTPTLVQRRLRTLAENRFITDVILSNNVPASGGAVQYEQNESIFPDRVAESIAPGGEYPLSPISFGPSIIAAVEKWGLDTLITDEAIRRQLMNPVARGMLKLVNGIVKQVDTVSLAAIALAVTQTQAVATAWSTSTKILRDILTAKATIYALNQGYDPDTLVVDDITYATVMSDPTVTNAIRREDPQNPVYSGSFPEFAGLRILPTPNLPVGSTAWVLDAKVLGGHGDEVPLTSSSIRVEEEEQWRLRAKRITVPFVMEPAACVKITGI